MQEENKVSDQTQRDPSAPGQVVYDENSGRFIAAMLIGFALLLVGALWLGS